MHPVITSPILPHPLPFTNTVVDPVVIAAACAGQGAPGNKCVVLLSPCLLIPVPLTFTLELHTSLRGVEQCGISASILFPLHTAGICFLRCYKCLQSIIPKCNLSMFFCCMAIPFGMMSSNHRMIMICTTHC